MSVLHALAAAVTTESPDDDLRAAAGVASLALTLLTFFTNLRREALKKFQEDASPLSRETFAAAVPDIALPLLTGAAAITLTPLLLDTFEFDQVGRRAGTISSFFGLIWLGFVGMTCFQVLTLVQRFRAAADAGKPTPPNVN